jgi:hypothetical protein
MKVPGVLEKSRAKTNRPPSRNAAPSMDFYRLMREFSLRIRAKSGALLRLWVRNRHFGKVGRGPLFLPKWTLRSATNMFVYQQ